MEANSWSDLAKSGNMYLTRRIWAGFNCKVDMGVEKTEQWKPPFRFGA